MAKVSIDSFPLRNALSSQPVTADVAVDRWLEQLLKHFSVQQLDTISTQEIAAYLANCLDNSNGLEAKTSNNPSQAVTAQSQQSHLSRKLNRNSLAAELKRRVMRLAGVQLDRAFLSMASNVIDETVVEKISLLTEGRQLQGVRYRGDIYRQVDSFQLCHQLQAYCLAQTLSEQNVRYLITRSANQFIVWANIRTFPKQNSRAIC